MTELHKRLGVVAIIIQNRDSARQINEILTDFSHLIIGRLGLPQPQREISIISIIVEGTTDDIGAMTGKIGQVPHATVKTAFAKVPQD